MNYSKLPQRLHLLFMDINVSYHLQTLINRFCTRFAHLRKIA